MHAVKPGPSCETGIQQVAITLFPGPCPATAHVQETRLGTRTCTQSGDFVRMLL